MGAKIIDWAGVDGIHYCKIYGFGEMVFAISLMNVAPNYVHPLFRTFSVYLRLLLACGSCDAREQAWGTPVVVSPRAAERVCLRQGRLL